MFLRRKVRGGSATLKGNVIRQQQQQLQLPASSPSGPSNTLASSEGRKQAESGENVKSGAGTGKQQQQQQQEGEHRQLINTPLSTPGSSSGYSSSAPLVLGRARGAQTEQRSVNSPLSVNAVESGSDRTPVFNNSPSTPSSTSTSMLVSSAVSSANNVSAPPANPAPIQAEFRVVVMGAKNAGKSGVIMSYIRSLDPTLGRSFAAAQGAYVAWKKRVSIEGKPFMLELRQLSLEGAAGGAIDGARANNAVQGVDLSLPEHGAGGRAKAIADFARRTSLPAPMSAQFAEDVKRATAFILIYNAFDPQSFEAVGLMHKFVQACENPDPPIVLVGNRPPGRNAETNSIMGRQGRELATSLGVSFFESAVSGSSQAQQTGTIVRDEGILGCFTETIRNCYLQWQSRAEGTTPASPELRPAFQKIGQEQQQTRLSRIDSDEIKFDPVSLKAAGETNTLTANTDTVAQIRSATLEKLIERVTYEKHPDTNLVLTFLLTYKSFTTGGELIRLLRSRYDIKPPDGIADSPEALAIWVRTVQTPIQLRVFNVVKFWLSHHFRTDFAGNRRLQAALRQFVQEDFLAPGQSPAQKSCGSQLIKLLERGVRDEAEVKELVFSHKPPKPIVSKKIEHSTRLSGEAGDLSILDIDALEFARQLALLDQDTFKAIDPQECIGQPWNNSDPEVVRTKAMNITRMIQRFNRMSAFIRTEILRQEKLKARVAVLKHLIMVAEHSRRLNNFNGVVVVTSGLENAAVYRLRKTWKCLSKKKLALYDDLKAYMDTRGSYKNLRHALHHSNPPIVPYLGVYLSDLTFIEDGNRDVVDGGLINFDKRRKLASVIREIQQYQQTPFCLQLVPAIREWLSSLDGMDDDACYRLSCLIEPREGANADAVKLITEAQAPPRLTADEVDAAKASAAANARASKPPSKSGTADSSPSFVASQPPSLASRVTHRNTNRKMSIGSNIIGIGAYSALLEDVSKQFCSAKVLSLPFGIMHSDEMFEMVSGCPESECPTMASLWASALQAAIVAKHGGNGDLLLPSECELFEEFLLQSPKALYGLLVSTVSSANALTGPSGLTRFASDIALLLSQFCIHADDYDACSMVTDFGALHFGPGDVSHAAVCIVCWYAAKTLMVECAPPETHVIVESIRGIHGEMSRLISEARRLDNYEGFQDSALGIERVRNGWRALQLSTQAYALTQRCDIAADGRRVCMKLNLRAFSDASRALDACRQHQTNADVDNIAACARLLKKLHSLVTKQVSADEEFLLQSHVEASADLFDVIEDYLKYIQQEYQLVHRRLLKSFRKSSNLDAVSVAADAAAVSATKAAHSIADSAIEAELDEVREMDGHVDRAEVAVQMFLDRIAADQSMTRRLTDAEMKEAYALFQRVSAVRRLQQDLEANVPALFEMLGNDPPIKELEQL